LQFCDQQLEKRHFFVNNVILWVHLFVALFKYVGILSKIILLIVWLLYYRRYAYLF
jgi:hypothetical protein